MVHTITSSNIPPGAAPFDQIWQAPADTFFQYVPQIAGLYEYVCTPHIPNGMVGSFNVIGDITGLTDGKLSENELLIYPNPTTDIIHLNKSNFVYTYKIFTSNGKLKLSGKTNETVNVSTLANGNYFIEIVGDRTRVLKFIKQ